METEGGDRIKLEFASRLSRLCDDMGVVQGRGRQTALALLFKVTPNGARKWLLGLALPELDMAIRIAQWAGVNVTWLLQGSGPMRGDKVDPRPGDLIDAVKELPSDDGQQVFDFIRYKFERAEGWFDEPKVARYMKLLDQFKRAPPSSGKKQ